MVTTRRPISNVWPSERLKSVCTTKCISKIGNKICIVAKTRGLSPSYRQTNLGITFSLYHPYQYSWMLDCCFKSTVNI